MTVFERRDLGSGSHALVATPLVEIGVLAAFTERGGGVSAPPFDGLNVSFSVGDDPASVRENRDRIVRGLEIDRFAIAGLVHGGKITRIGPKRGGAGYLDPVEAVAATDGLATASKGVPTAVTTADCVPLIYASTSVPTITVVHAGWRGFAAGIVDTAMRTYEDPEAVRVAIGPAIGPCHYEVASDVALAVAAGSEAGAVTSGDGNDLRLDLVATAKQVLGAAGAGLVIDTGLCTACEAERFFSHRRDGTTGRQVAIGTRTSI
ncbi:MAG: polyphenol oxidase family protein [Actinomycetota bacterium]